MEIKNILYSFSELIDSYNSLSEISTKIEYEKNLNNFPPKYELLLLRLIYVIIQYKIKNLNYISAEEAKLVVDIVEGKATRSQDSLSVLNELLPVLLKVLAFTYTVYTEDYKILTYLLCKE